MEAVYYSETLVPISKSTRCQSMESHNVMGNFCENLKLDVLQSFGLMVRVPGDIQRSEFDSRRYQIF
jgi:hypothetical protein